MADDIKSQVELASKTALKQGEKQELGALRLILAAFKQHEVDSREAVDDKLALTILTKLAKQRRESISQFAAAGRDDLVAQEEFELKILEAYLPAAAGEQEITAAIAEAISAVNAESPKDMGTVMGVLTKKLQGRADMGVVSQQVKAALSG